MKLYLTSSFIDSVWMILIVFSKEENVSDYNFFLRSQVFCFFFSYFKQKWKRNAIDLIKLSINNQYLDHE